MDTPTVLHCMYRKSENFHFRSRWQLQKLILRKLAYYTINANAVRGHSYEIFLHGFRSLSYESFQIYGTPYCNILLYNKLTHDQVHYTCIRYTIFCHGPPPPPPEMYL